VGTTTHDLVDAEGHYAVNVLSEDQRWLSDRFAGQQDEMEDPFSDVDVTRAETGAPIIEDSLAYLDCSLWAAYDGGDHTIYVGEVQDCAVTTEDGDPLTFFRGRYGMDGEE
jgi:flavin reductase (DIM6/NTAB) family NADH-FMN oxidoreductase RutF